MKNKYKFLDYLLIIGIWVLIFGKNMFSHMLFVDYTYSTFFDFWKVLSTTNLHYSYLLDILKLVLAPFNLIYLTFTLSILISMLISYFYIKKMFKDKEMLFVILFSLIFFFNPFVYSRIMIGQLGVLLAYLLLPVYLYYLFNLFENNLERKSIIKVAIAYTIIALFSIHFFLLNFFIFLIASFCYRDKIKPIKYAKIFGIFVLLLILLNSFWLQSLFSNQIFSTINSEHESFFAPKMSVDVSAAAKILGMWGFWREAGYITTFNTMNVLVWYFLLTVLILLLISGYYFSNPDKKSKIFYSLFWVGLILGIGISHPYTGVIFDWLFSHIPFFNGLRDSHKLVSFIALAYAYFIPTTILKIRDRINKKYLKVSLIVFSIGFILIYTYPLIFLSNQIKSAEYPQNYYEINNYLENQEITGNIIYLPWGTYFTYNWTFGTSSDGRIAVPINQIVKNNVIGGPDEFGSADSLTSNIGNCLSNESMLCLEEQGVQYVLKDKCAYYPDSYSFVNSSEVYSSECIDIYRLDNKINAEKNTFPLNFILWYLISFLTIVFLIFYLRKSGK